MPQPNVDARRLNLFGLPDLRIIPLFEEVTPGSQPAATEVRP